MPVKPSDQESEYFARLELGKRRKAEQEREAHLAREEMEREKELHFMKCPKCGMDLTELEVRGLKVDSCTACKGIWLDPGELEALTECEPPLLQRFLEVFR